jgi:ABC-type multidrug transport system fused ATPase/permease subunit
MIKLWDYYHTDAVRLIWALCFFLVALALSKFGFYLPAIIGFLISSYLVLVTILHIPKVIGFPRALIVYLAQISAFVFCYAHIYIEYGIVQNEIIETEYLNHIYFSIVTWTTLGYGDFQPTPASRIWAASEAIIGYLFMGILVGLFLAFLTPEKSQFSGKERTKKYSE